MENISDFAWRLVLVWTNKIGRYGDVNWRFKTWRSLGMWLWQTWQLHYGGTSSVSRKTFLAFPGLQWLRALIQIWRVRSRFVLSCKLLPAWSRYWWHSTLVWPQCLRNYLPFLFDFSIWFPFVIVKGWSLYGGNGKVVQYTAKDITA